MSHFLALWGQNWGTDPQPRAVGTGFRRSGIDPGDESFVLLTGSRVGRRIIAHGTAVGSVYRAPRAEDPTRTTNWVDVDWNVWLSPGFGMSLEQAAEAAPSFYWDIWHGGSHIEEGDLLRKAWERHLDSLPETAFSGEPAKSSPRADHAEVSAIAAAPTVRVDFHEPVPVPDLWSDGTFRADRHYLDASSAHQDAHEMIFVRSSGEIACRWPTSKIRSIEWLDPNGNSQQQDESPASEPSATQEVPPGNPQRLAADPTGAPEALSVPPARAGESWSSDEDAQLADEVRAAISLMEIVRRHERSAGAIRSRLKKRGLLAHDSAILRHFREGWSIDELAEHYGETPTAIREQFKRSGVDLDEPAADEGTPDPASDTVPPSPPEQPATGQKGSVEEDFAHDLCRHEVETNQCGVCKDDDKPNVYITAGGAAFHGRPDCPALAIGQRSVERRGGDAAEVRRVRRNSGEVVGRQPCHVCLPSES